MSSVALLTSRNPHTRHSSRPQTGRRKLSSKYTDLLKIEGLPQIFSIFPGFHSILRAAALGSERIDKIALWHAISRSA